MFDIEKPLPVPLRMTLAPGAAVNTIGASDVPELEMLTCSVYVPAATWTVVPAVAFAPAVAIVQNGVVESPGPASEQDGFDLSTNMIVAARAVTVAEPSASSPTVSRSAARACRNLPRRLRKIVGFTGFVIRPGRLTQWLDLGSRGGRGAATDVASGTYTLRTFPYTILTIPLQTHG